MHRLLVAFAVLVIGLTAPAASAQSTAATDTSFTYQGRLENAGAPANGDFDFTFTLYDSLAGGAALGPSVNQTLTVDEGLFTTLLDFGVSAIQGNAIFLEIRVGPKGLAKSTLSPRQRVSSAPTSVQSGAANLLADGTVVLQRDLGNEGVTISNQKPDNTFDDSATANPFWQTFVAPIDGYVTSGSFIVKALANPQAPDLHTLVRGEGPGGEVVGQLLFNNVIPIDATLMSVIATVVEPIPVRAGETYTWVIPNTNLNYTEIPIIGPGVGRCVFGANVATWFSLVIRTGTDPVVLIEPNGSLNLQSRDPQIEFWQDRPGAESVIRSWFDSAGSTFTRWETRTFEFVQQFDFVGGLGRKNLLTLNGANEFIGIRESSPITRFHVRDRDTGLLASALSNDEMVIEDTDAVLGIYSQLSGTFGSGITLGETNAGTLNDKWSMMRRSSTFNGELQFAYGPNADQSANTINFALRPNGSAWLRGALQQNSSATQKHDVETLTDAIDTLLRLRGVSYKWNDSDQPDIGFLAEEMAQVLPEIVGFDENHKPIGIDYGRVTALIVEATKDQERRLSEQERLIRELLGRVEALEADRED